MMKSEGVLKGSNKEGVVSKKRNRQRGRKTERWGKNTQRGKKGERVIKNVFFNLFSTNYINSQLKKYEPTRF